MKNFQHIFFRGLFTFLPIAITIYIIYSVILIVENLLGNFLKSLLPTTAYIPGYGFLLTLVLIFLFGLMLNNFLVRSLLENIEKRFAMVPFIKTIYSPLRDLMNLFSKKSDSTMKSVVLVHFQEGGPQFLGLVTREDFSDLTELKAEADQRIVVYIPMSYGLGGFSTLVLKKNITYVDLPIEKAMSLAITAWVKSTNAPEFKLK